VHGHALQATSSTEDFEVFKSLIKTEADIHAQGGFYGEE
jgi:hypothetical protein